MTTIQLQNEEYFTYCEMENNLVSRGDLSGDYILCTDIKGKKFQPVICVDTQEVYFISKK